MRTALIRAAGRTAALAAAITFSYAAIAHVAARDLEVRVITGANPGKDDIVKVEIPAAAAKRLGTGSIEMLFTPGRGDKRPAQLETDGGRTTLTFVLPQTRSLQALQYRVQKAGASQDSGAGVRVTRVGEDVQIDIDGKLFTRYTTKSGPNKPFFYPILTPDGKQMTRRWPTEPNALPGESHDHVHHRGLWFTHSSVNGVDFWSEQGKVGRTINKSFDNLVSGPVYGGFHAATEWRTPDDKLVATDERSVRVYKLPSGDRLLDFRITIHPVGGPLLFGDAKDGTFGLRVPDSMAVTADRSSKIPGMGHIEMSTGVTGKAAWGKRADWVDYWGPVDAETWGVAIFDAPSNLRHPTTWHARDYSLFTANPFGLHDFGMGAKGAGDFTVPADGKLDFHYGVLFHAGDTQTAQIAEEYAGFADTPKAIAIQ